MMITTVVVWMMLMLMKRPVTHLPYIIPVMESMLFLAPPLFLPSPIHDDIHHHHSFYYQHPQHPTRSPILFDFVFCVYDTQAAVHCLQPIWC